jgi:soluble lytic murein transglycosylase
MAFMTIFFIFINTLSADIYFYKDEQGVFHFSNTPEHKKYTKFMSEDTQTSKSSHIYQYSNIINTISKKYNIHPSLVNAVIKVESNWNTKAVSKKGALGLMQLMPSTAKEMQVSNPFDPIENIEGGIRYLRYLLDTFNGDLDLALAAYNAGPETVERFRGIPPISETRNYIKKVRSIYQPNEQEISNTIYKILKEDGTVLYTNTPFMHQTSAPLSFK